MTLDRRRLLAGLSAAALTPPAFAQSPFPSQVVRIIVPFSTGTGSDAVARLVAPTLNLGQQVVVENRGGAGGISGTEQGANATPDGHTLTLGTSSTMITNPVLNTEVRYRVERDFAPVAGLARTYFAIVTANTPEAPQTLSALVERLRAGNGEYGSSGVGTITHLASEMFLKVAGVRAEHVPYRGSGQVQTDIIGGRLLFGSDTLAAVLPLVKGGRLRALAVSSEARVASLPDVPTVAEAGHPQLRVNAWFGLFAPKATPAAHVERINTAARDALRSPELRERLTALELDPLDMSAAQFGDFLRTDTAFWTDFLRTANIRLAP